MKSTDVNVNDATIYISEMKTAPEISEFVIGDTRKTVQAAAESRIAEIMEGKEPVAATPKDKDLLAFERPYSTIIIPKGNDKNDQKTVTVKISGSLENGNNYTYARVLRRGVKEFNVPANIIQMISEAVITDYVNEEKLDKTGKELVAEQRPRWTVQVVDQYDAKKTEEEVKREMGIK